MDCKVSAESLVDFHFGTIAPAERAKVESHLTHCHVCLQNYFDLKRDIEIPPLDEKPSEIVRHRIRKDFHAYAEALFSADQRAWLSANRVRVTLGLSIAAAALFMILFSGPMKLGMNNSSSPDIRETNPQTETESESLRSLDEAVDSGRLSPGHINMI